MCPEVDASTGMATFGADGHMRYLLQQIATGPELSKDVSREEARLGMQIVLEGKAHPVQAALYLIALRMKRETDEELLGVQEALLDSTRAVEAQVEELIEVADPFNGYVRGLPVSPFLPPLLAECGVPALCHGTESAGPKHGITHRKVLRAAGERTDCSLNDVAQRLANPDIGWGYLDQSISCPALDRLQELRDLMVKRTCLTTLEVALRPVRAKRRTHLVTGYVHKAYPRVYAMLARHAGYDSALIVRGVEGGVVPSLQQPSKAIRYVGDGCSAELRFEPSDFGISGAAHRAIPLPGREGLKGTVDPIAFDADEMAMAAANSGLSALRGRRGLAYDSLLYAGSIILEHLGRGTRRDCSEVVRQALNSGAAAERLGIR